MGNGDIGLNVWVEESGDICFYIGKTDSWGDNGRLLKVGKVRVKMRTGDWYFQNDFFSGIGLNRQGSIKISATGGANGKQTDLSFNLWVDANNPVVHLTYDCCSVPLSMTANIELWRTEPYSLPNLEVSDLLEERSKPGSLHKPVIVEPDHLITESKNYIGWYHHNNKSIGFDLTNKLQGLNEFYENDPILDRTFGAIITGLDAKKINNSSLQTKASKKGRMNIFVLTKQPSQPDKWLEAVSELAENTESIPFEERKLEHEKVVVILLEQELDICYFC